MRKDVSHFKTIKGFQSKYLSFKYPILFTGDNFSLRKEGSVYTRVNITETSVTNKT